MKGVISMNFDTSKLIAIGGTILTLAATVVGKISDDKKLKDEVAKEVAKQLKKHQRRGPG